MYAGSNNLTREIIAYFDEFLKKIDYPHFINRQVRNLKSFNDWKASSSRIFLLYLSLPFLLFFHNYFSSPMIYHYSL